MNKLTPFEESIKSHLPDGYFLMDLIYGGDDLGFSWRHCECCGSQLGGNRYRASLFKPGSELIDLDVCVDCVMYIANGDLPDDWKIK